MANSMCNSPITALDVADDVLIASIHLELASTIIRYIFPLTSAEKSRWSLTLGRVGHFHGCMGATGGVGLCN